MARFHFNISDGQRFPDDEGTELPNISTARCEAVRVLADFMRNDPCDFWSTRSFELTVTDDRGLALFRLDVSATDSAALSKGGTPLGVSPLALQEDRGMTKRYVRRDKEGEFTDDQVDIDRSSATDQPQHSETRAKPGQGDRGD